MNNKLKHYTHPMPLSELLILTSKGMLYGMIMIPIWIFLALAYAPI